MESLRNLQVRALRQLFEAPSLQLRSSSTTRQTVSSIGFRTRPAALPSAKPSRASRSFHTCRPNQSQRLAAPTQSIPSFLRRFAPRRAPHNFSRSTRRFQSSTSGTVSEENLSLSQRLRKLSREYGWSAVGVYLALSALDFPFCFLAVKLLGTDRIGHWEHVVLSYVKGLLQWPLGESGQEIVEEVGEGAKDLLTEAKKQVEVGEQVDTTAADGKRLLDVSGEYAVEDHGYRDAEKANTGTNASIWTQLALAYAIHKSFIFIRVPLTAAVTPKIVKTLRGWGWNIGKRPQTGRFAKKTKLETGTGINTGKTGVKTDK